MMTKNKIKFRGESFIDSTQHGDYIFQKIDGILTIQIIIKSKSGLSPRIKELNKKYVVKKCSVIKDLENCFELLIPFESNEQIHTICNAYYQSGLVEFCVPQKKYPLERVNQSVEDPKYIDQWIFNNTGQYSGRAGEDIKLEQTVKYISEKGIQLNNEVKIAILDDGVAPNHEDLSQLSFVNNFDLIDNDSRPTPAGVRTHGTNIAGIISALVGNGIGIRGINSAVKLINGRIGIENFNEVLAAQGIRRAVDSGARIINLSWAVPERRPIIIPEIEYAISRNVLVVAAAGNYLNADDAKRVHFPANMDQVLAVGACDQLGRWVNLRNCAVEDGRNKFGSRYGREVDIVAPGISILTTKYKTRNNTGADSYNLFDGTSAATAIVSGVASLLLCINPNLTADQLKSIILSTADDIRSNHNTGDEITFEHMGHGRINAFAAVKKVVEG
jgi:subtilisin family serine protease